MYTAYLHWLTLWFKRDAAIHWR